MAISTGDIDSIYAALRPRLLKMMGSGTVSSVVRGAPGPVGPPGPKGVTWKGAWADETNYDVGDLAHHPTAGAADILYICLVAHTSVAATPPVPGGNTQWAEVGQDYLIVDGSRAMTGALNMGHHSIADADDADIEGTASIGEDAAVTRDVSVGRNLSLTGPTGQAVASGVRVLHMAGDDLDGEALIDGVERVLFNNEPTKSVIQNPSLVSFNVSVVPGTHTADSEGNVSWSAVERMLQAYTEFAEVHITLGSVAQLWNNGGLLGRFVVCYFNGSEAIKFNDGSAWSPPTYVPMFGVSMHGVESGPVWFMKQGTMRGLNTSAWPVGTVLWANGLDENPTDTPSTDDDAWPGMWPLVRVGVVRVQHATDGIVDIDVCAYPPHNMLLGRQETAAHVATAIVVTAPNGSLTGSTVQANIDELEAQKVGRRWSYAMKGF